MTVENPHFSTLTESQKDRASRNIEHLRENAYPGRGIVLGMTESGSHYVQVYWVMGRSENSRNRLLVEKFEDNSFLRKIKTEPFDASKVKDPSLIIYNAMRERDIFHIVSNGDQTDTVYDFLSRGMNPDDALETRDPEPDAPNFTPRITGLTETGDEEVMSLHIIRFIDGEVARDWYEVSKEPGLGHCLHTYRCDGEPIPSFDSDPYVVPMGKTIDQIADKYWDVINKDNKVALIVKGISRENGEITYTARNKHPLPPVRI